MSEENKETTIENTNDPVKKITRIALIVIAVMFVWYVIADRLAPWTDQGRVQFVGWALPTGMFVR